MLSSEALFTSVFVHKLNLLQEVEQQEGKTIFAQEAKVEYQKVLHITFPLQSVMQQLFSSDKFSTSTAPKKLEVVCDHKWFPSPNTWTSPDDKLSSPPPTGQQAPLADTKERMREQMRRQFVKASDDTIPSIAQQECKNVDQLSVW